MIPRGLPFQRWPWHYHAWVAGFVVVSFAAGAWWWLHVSEASVVALQSELQAAQNQLEVAQRTARVGASSNYTQALPSAARADDVARDISRYAQAHGVQVVSVSLETRAATASEIAKVQFNLVAQADYRAAKMWLTELLGRYPSLGVQSLSLRALPNEAARQDVRLVLVFFAKD